MHALIHLTFLPENVATDSILTNLFILHIISKTEKKLSNLVSLSFWRLSQAEPKIGPNLFSEVFCIDQFIYQKFIQFTLYLEFLKLKDFELIYVH